MHFGEIFRMQIQIHHHSCKSTAPKVTTLHNLHSHKQCATISCSTDYSENENLKVLMKNLLKIMQESLKKEEQFWEKYPTGTI